MSRVTTCIPGKGFRIPKLVEVAKRDCEFVRYQDGKLWYRVDYSTIEGPDDYPELRAAFAGSDHTILLDWQFEFPVTLGDDTAGVFQAQMPGVNLMRWMRKHIEYLTEARKGDGDGA